jgi:purine-binding chemotaxis protein CheW
LASSQTTILEQLAAARTLLFRVAGSVYGCDIDAVREIIPYRRATRLPGAPPYVQGLINLRGTIVTVLDLGARLDAARAPMREAGSGGSIILAEHGARVVGVAVDEVLDVQAIAEEPLDGANGDTHGGLVRGLGHLGDDVVVLIDIHTLVTQVLL